MVKNTEILAHDTGFDKVLRGWCGCGVRLAAPGLLWGGERRIFSLDIGNVQSDMHMCSLVAGASCAQGPVLTNVMWRQGLKSFSLTLTMKLKIILTFWSSCLYFTRAGLIGVHICLHGTEDQIQGYVQACPHPANLATSPPLCWFLWMKWHTGNAKFPILSYLLSHINHFQTNNSRNLNWAKLGKLKRCSDKQITLRNC